MEKIRKCIICGKIIEDHGKKYCRKCRQEAYKASSRNWKKKQYHIIPEAGYESLARAIIQQACRDFRIAEYHDEVVKFLKGRRCFELTGVDGQSLLNGLEKRSVRRTKRTSLSEKTFTEIREKIIDPE